MDAWELDRAHDLAEALQVNRTLKKINLEMTGLGVDAGAVAVAAALTQHPALEFINLGRKSNTPSEKTFDLDFGSDEPDTFANAVLEALTKSLKSNSTLTELHLECMAINEQNVQYLAQQLFDPRLLFSTFKQTICSTLGLSFWPMV